MNWKYQEQESMMSIDPDFLNVLNNVGVWDSFR